MYQRASNFFSSTFYFMANAYTAVCAMCMSFRYTGTVLTTLYTT